MSSGKNVQISEPAGGTSQEPVSLGLGTFFPVGSGYILSEEWARPVLKCPVPHLSFFGKEEACIF